MLNLRALRPAGLAGRAVTSWLLQMLENVCAKGWWEPHLFTDQQEYGSPGIASWDSPSPPIYPHHKTTWLGNVVWAHQILKDHAQTQQNTSPAQKWQRAVSLHSPREAGHSSRRGLATPCLSQSEPLAGKGFEGGKMMDSLSWVPVSVQRLPCWGCLPPSPATCAFRGRDGGVWLPGCQSWNHF